MTHTTSQFDLTQRTGVNEAVAAAEAKTGAEIVPVIAARSGRYDRSEDVCGLWLGVILLIIAWLTYPRTATHSGAWTAWPTWVEPIVYVAVVVLGFVLGAMIASRSGALQRLFTSRAQLREETLRRAQSLFFDHRIHHTQRSTGVMIYISLMEHEAAILADQTVTDAVGHAAIEQWRDALVARLKESDCIDALCATIQMIGDALSTSIPGDHSEVNELPDALVME